MILISVLVVGGAAFAYAKHQTKMYTATAYVAFQSTDVNQQAAGVQLNVDTDPQLTTATDIELAALTPGAQAAAAAVGRGITAGDINSAISVSEVGQTNVGAISATWTDPTLAAAMANADAQQFIATRRAELRGNVAEALADVTRQVRGLTRLETLSSDGQALIQRQTSLQVLNQLETGDSQLVTAASPPTAPSSPRVTRDVAIGLALGLLLGILLALLLERQDRTLNDVDSIEEAFELSLLGTVPTSRSYARGLASVRNGGRPLGPSEAEAFRMLRAYLRYFNVDRELRSLLITSAASGDGKTTVACHLAETAAKMGSSVLLLEADLRRPSIAKLFGLGEVAGLSEVLIATADFDHAVVRVFDSADETSSSNGAAGRGGSLDVLTAGMIPPNPARLLESDTMQHVLATATSRYELVIIDTPPLTAVADAIPLITKVDAAVIVARVGKTTRDEASRLRSDLATMNAPILGVVANAASSAGQYGKHYEYRAFEPTQAPKLEPSEVEAESEAASH
ncbi:MAG: polysaccharide biosynthesis tyrosine autokinase [Solirubrobacteraceae bacterium]